MKQILTRLTCVALFVTSATAVAQLPEEDQIKFRQSGYTFMAWNMGKLKAQLIDKSVPFDQQQVQAAANLIAATANSGMGALYGPGTDKGTGWKETRLKSEFFQQPEKVREIAISFVTEANKLKEVAASGDQAAMAAQFGKVGESCKACHDNFREKE